MKTSIPQQRNSVSLNLFQSFISGSVHKVFKYNIKYKIMFNKRKKKNSNVYVQFL